MLVNLRMPNGHIVEVQLHVNKIMDVKNGVGHKLYEQIRSIEARAVAEGRQLTLQEALKVRDIRLQMQRAYDEAMGKASSGGK